MYEPGCAPGVVAENDNDSGIRMQLVLIRVIAQRPWRDAGALVRQAARAWAACAIQLPDEKAFADEVQVGVVRVGWSTGLKILEEGRPVTSQLVRFEVTQRKPEAVVEADEGGRVAPQSLRDPRRVQCVRGLGGGGTATRALARPARWTRSSLRLDVGVTAPESSTSI